MPTSPLYDTTHAMLRQRLPTVIASQVANLSLFVIGAVQSMSSQLAKIARAMPLKTTHMAKEQRIRRWLDNPRITQADHYHPIVKQALHGLKGQRVQLLLDRVVLQDTHNLLVVSVAFRRRSIPLMWVALSHQGSSTLEDRQGLIEPAVRLLPPGVRISIHGDSEFRGLAFYQWLREQGYDAMLGVVGYGLVSTTESGVDTAGHSTVQRLDERVGTARGVLYLSDVYVGEARYGPVNMLAWWEHDDDGKRVMRGAMTNLAAQAATKRLGKRRMWIETVFRDWQSGGFHLDQSGITDRDRLAQLLIILAIAYLWLVSVGRWVVKRSYRTRIDDGSSRHWHFSLFQLGVGWMQHCHSFGQSLPLMLYLYL
jgi:Transposase DDE domain